MTEPVGQWRATYNPGDWVVLAGPTSVVVLEPASGDWSDLIGTIWQEVVNSSSITELAAALASYQLDTMPSFGAFFWTRDGMRSLVRGAVEVVDQANGQVVASGEGVQTWNEAGLAGVQQVRLELPSPEPDPAAPAVATLELPLVVGAALASAVVLDCSDQAQVYSPQGQDVDQAAYGAAAGAEPGAPTEAYDVGAALAAESRDPDPAPDDPAPDDPRRTPASADAAREPGAGGPATPPFETDVENADTDPQGIVLDEEEEPSGAADGDGDRRAFLENADTQFMVIPPVEVPPPGIPAAAAAGAGAIPSDITQQLDPDLRVTLESDSDQQTPTAEMSQDSMVMAVVCQYGHTSPQNATVCRVCGTPIAPQGPHLVVRPPLAVLRASNGESIRSTARC